MRSCKADVKTIPALSVETPDITELGSGLTERDVYLIRSIEWLTMVPATNEDALRVSNDVGRYFLGEPPRQCL